MTALWILGGIAIAVVATVVVSFAIMYLWNWLAPQIFKLPTIKFKHALGLFILSRLLFGGFGGWHGGRHHYGNHHYNQAKCQQWKMDSEKKK